MSQLSWVCLRLAAVGVLVVFTTPRPALAQGPTEIEVISEPPPQAEPPPGEPATPDPPPAEPPPAPPLPEVDKPKEPLGHLRVGGGIGLGFASDLITVGVSPQVSYIFKRIVEPGVSIRYTYTRDNAPLQSITWHTYGSSLFVRVFPIQQLFILVEGEVINTGSKQGGIRFPRETYGNLLLGGGFVVGVSKGVFVATSLKVPVLRNPFYPTAFPIISVGAGYGF
ncbi:MAG: hypothetical protein KJN97_19350 [Deltaproteobacteria bacterium]|nr:hypothetical protein [Deltaproteobacteria bacterium]